MVTALSAVIGAQVPRGYFFVGSLSGVPPGANNALGMTRRNKVLYENAFEQAGNGAYSRGFGVHGRSASTKSR
ncbi:MAG: hypothetical protein ACXWBH_13355, partial [Candidatus Angelobacter sp.]